MQKHPDAHSANCEACGKEFLNIELRSAKLAGFPQEMRICKGCFNLSTLDDYKAAADILNSIVKIANTKRSPEERLDKIVRLLSDE